MHNTALIKRCGKVRVLDLMEPKRRDFITLLGGAAMPMTKEKMIAA
jgi:hypothetical protein